ncbi:MAG: DUF4350 domain-containing protein [Myxococcota bacterium]
MTRELGLAGCLALAFGLGAYYATGRFGAFSALNVGLGLLALATSIARGAVSLYTESSRAAHSLVWRGLAGVGVAGALAVVLFQGARWLDWRADWTFEQRYQVSEATQRAVEELCGPVELLHFHEPGDPRNRRTALLLDAIARFGDVHWRGLSLAEAPAEADHYGIGRSNSVVVRLRGEPGTSDHFERVTRPTEGGLYEALYRLCGAEAATLLSFGGHGEGDLARGDAPGFAGLAAALATEGYTLRRRSSLALSEVPAEVDAVLVLAPERALPDRTVVALERHLDRGGSLIAFLEPGVRSGLEPLLERFGLASPDAELRDPEGVVDAPAEIAARHYETHPITDGLDASRFTFFVGARSFALRRTEPDARVGALVYASPRSRLVDPAAPDSEVEAAGSYRPIAVRGRYPRGAGEARIFAVGDADFASNRHLRSVYNLDLVLNGVHWALGREPAITLRPKLRDRVQFPLPATDALQSFYGLGLLVPELLLLTGLWLALRRRAG